MQPLQFEYTTRELFGNHFSYWPAYELTIRYTTDGDDITITGAEINTGSTKFCASTALHADMARFYHAPLLSHAATQIDKAKDTKNA